MAGIVPLCGRAYERTICKLSPSAKRNYNTMLDAHFKAEPQKWKDVLTATQERRLRIVTDPEEWGPASRELSRGLEEVPVLCVGVLGTSCPTHILLSDHSAHVVVVDLASIEGKLRVSGECREVVPWELKQWLESAYITKITCNDEEELNVYPYRLPVENAVSTKFLYEKMARKCRWPILDRERSSGMESQSSWALGYHHRRCDEADWVALMGKHK